MSTLPTEPRAQAENPLRETAFAALQRATRHLSLQRKIRLLPTTASAALFVIFVLAVVLGMLSRHEESVASARHQQLVMAIAIGLVTLGATIFLWIF